MTRKSMQAVLWCAVYAFLLLTLVTPLSMLTINLIMVPLIILFAIVDVKRFLLAYAISVAAVFALTGTFGTFLLLLSLFFLPPSAVMGFFYKRKSSARTTLTAGAITLLSEFLLTLLIGYMAGLKPMEKLQDFLYESLENVPEALKATITKAQADLAVHYFMQLVPLMLISASLYYVFITHGVGRWLLKKIGVIVPGLPPAREWMLPRSFVWYFLIVTVLDLFIKIETDSAVAMFVWNLLPLLTVAFSVQAVGFFFFLAHAKGWNKAIPVLIVIAGIFLFPLSVYAFCVIGVLDVAFPLRKRIAGHF